jgi:hypothetical protein
MEMMKERLNEERKKERKKERKQTNKKKEREQIKGSKRIKEEGRREIRERKGGRKKERNCTIFQICIKHLIEQLFLSVLLLIAFSRRSWCRRSARTVAKEKKKKNGHNYDSFDRW